MLLLPRRGSQLSGVSPLNFPPRFRTVQTNGIIVSLISNKSICNNIIVRWDTKCPSVSVILILFVENIFHKNTKYHQLLLNLSDSKKQNVSSLCTTRLNGSRDCCGLVSGWRCARPPNSCLVWYRHWVFTLHLFNHYSLPPPLATITYTQMSSSQRRFPQNFQICSSAI